MSNNTGKQGTEVQQPAPDAVVKDNPRRIDNATINGMLETELAERFAIAILGNPRADQILGTDPFSPGRAGDSATVGEHLARQTHRLASQYLAAIKQLAGK